MTASSGGPRPAPDDVREWALAADRREFGRRREDSGASVAFWQEVIDGRLRLVKRFESDGRRYYVARENHGSSRDAALDARERSIAETIGSGESTKVAAYKLGVQPAAVTAKLRTTLLKLGLRSRVDLVMLVGATCGR
jgi:DNA-binding NarL/FixJ family response regulator